MKKIAQTFHFLGSVHLAVTLIGVTALFVVGGTFLESKSASHRYAALYAYKHPAFLTLLGLYFVNILFAALRRWPFKRGHIPFLITHLGLLMIIAGTMLKQWNGVQGSMVLTEGSGSHEIFLPETYVVRIEKRQEGKTVVGQYNLSSRQSPFSELSIDLMGLSPHTHEKYETWIKGNEWVLLGLKPIQLTTWNKETFSPAGTARLFPPPHDPWSLYAIRTDDVPEAAKKIFLKSARIKISEINGKIIYEGLLEEAIRKQSSEMPVVILHLDYAPASGFIDPKILVSDSISKVEVALSGKGSLLNENVISPHLGRAPLLVDIETKPILAVIQDAFEDTHLIAFDPYGRVWGQPYRNSNLDSLIAYDEGFGGYAVSAVIPFHPAEGGRSDKETFLYDLLEKELRLDIPTAATLSPPVKLFYEACQSHQMDFAKTFIEFLKIWDNAHGWIMPDTAPLPEDIKKILEELPWDTIPSRDKIAAIWCSHFFHDIDPYLAKGISFRDLLSARQWPLPLSEYGTDDQEILTEVTQQIFAIGDLIKETDSVTPTAAALMSAFLRAHGIHLRTILPPSETIFNERKEIVLETPLTLRLKSAQPLSKLEENIPSVTLKFNKEGKEEMISLPFDRHGSGLRWPLFGGEYVIRFQPQLLSIPSHLRLRQARQINYSGTGQAFSYESDLLITDRATGIATESIISMNHVHETRDGYRFYLSNISSTDESAVKKISLTINFDPWKYYLTYPGGLILSLGITLLLLLNKNQFNICLFKKSPYKKL